MASSIQQWVSTLTRLPIFELLISVKAPMLQALPISVFPLIRTGANISVSLPILTSGSM